MPTFIVRGARTFVCVLLFHKHYILPHGTYGLVQFSLVGFCLVCFSLVVHFDCMAKRNMRMRTKSENHTMYLLRGSDEELV